MSHRILFFIFLIIPAITFSQSKADKETLGSLQRNIAEINLLSNNEKGSLTEQKWMASKFREAGVEPASDSRSYLQYIIHDAGRQFNPGTSLSINGKTLIPGTDFIPLPYSAQASASGDPLIAVQEANLPWIMDIGNYSGTQLTGSDTDVNATILKLAQEAAQNKATAVLFYNSNAQAKDIAFDQQSDIPPVSVPVVYIKHAAAMQYFKDQTADAKIQLKVSFYDKKDTAYNVIGSIYNGAASTVVISAGQPGDKAALITLTQLLKNNRHYHNKNYLFISFAKPDGAKYYFTHPVISTDQTACMIFLNEKYQPDGSGDTLTVTSMNTPSYWDHILRKVKPGELVIQYNNSEKLQEDSAPNIPSLTIMSGSDKANTALETVKYLAGLIRELNG